MIQVIIRTKRGKYIAREQPTLEAAKTFLARVRVSGLSEESLYIHPEEVRELEIIE